MCTHCLRLVMLLKALFNNSETRTYIGTHRSADRRVLTFLKYTRNVFGKNQDPPSPYKFFRAFLYNTQTSCRKLCKRGKNR